MKRRDFLGLAGAAAASVAVPSLVRAQTPLPKRSDGKPPLIAALVDATKAQSDIDTLGPFVKGMANLGYVQDRDYSLFALYDNGDATVWPGFAKQMVALSPDLILLATSNSLPVVDQETTTIPIVCGTVSVTILNTLIKSMAHPVGNATGILTDFASLTGKHCDIALDLVSGAKRIGALAYTLAVDGGAGTRDAVNAAASAHKFTPILVDVKQPEDIAPAFRMLADAHCNAAIVGSGAVFSSDRGRTAAGAAAVKIPAIYNEQGYVEAGGLISYGFDRVATFIRAADFAVRILQGAKPGDLPVEETQNYFMAINRATAASLGLTIPADILFRVDETV